jgi:hypothetical protein
VGRHRLQEGELKGRIIHLLGPSITQPLLPSHLENNERAIDLKLSCYSAAAERPSSNLPAIPSRDATGWCGLAARDQARRLPHHGAARRRVVRLYTRNGNDFTKRFLLIVASVMALPARSCLIDGEAIVSDDSGLAVFPS